MQIEIKTAAYAHNKNFNAIVDAIQAAGHKYHINLGGKRLSENEAVTITTDAPATVLDSVSFAKSAVTVRA